MSNHPFVSVIIPVYNDKDRLDKTLSALEQQTCSRNQYQVIVVDNNSTDGSQSVAKKYDNVTLLHESVQSPYAARNTGIEFASGEIIALLDATCIPDNDWLENGIKCLCQNDIDMIGGNIVFELSDPPTMAEIRDSKTNVQMKQNIESRNVAKTGNLFFYRYVVDKIGRFPANVRSGGDVYWTKKATNAGFHLEYCSSARVNYPAKQFKSLAKKQFRVGKGKTQAWKRNNGDIPPVIVKYILMLPNLFVMDTDEDTPEESKVDQSVDKKYRYLFVSSALIFFQIFGSIIEFIKSTFNLDSNN